MVRFHTTISLLKLYVSVRGNQRTLNNLKYIHAVINTLGSVVDVYSGPSLTNLCRFGVRAAYTYLLTMSDSVINSISSYF